MSMIVRTTVAITILACSTLAAAQDSMQAALSSIDARSEHYAEIAHEIWNLAEVGYQEYQSSEILQQQLSSAGFDVEAGVAAIPTAFVATYGNGGPVIAILAEYDALPGITQSAVPERQPVADKAAGHACGHHLFGTGSVAAAIAVREWLQDSGMPGTIRLYGTPAEEGGAGKVYMVRAGLFDDVDAVLHWHAGDRNTASAARTLANLSAKFRFHGVSAHAAGAPDRGRSALDGVEAMNHMVNLMREHVPDPTRIHYAITSGGSAPNVVPDFAEVYYYARHPEPTVLFDVFERIVNAANGAALGTSTTVDYEIISGVYSLLPNEALARAVDRNLRSVGGIDYESSETVFANRIRESLPDDARPMSAALEIEDFDTSEPLESVSTDVGDVSWVVPTAGLYTATWVPGTAAHSWQAVAAGGTSIGTKGMLVAAKTLTRTAIDLFSDPGILAEATAEYGDRVGTGFSYQALVGDREPALDYRSN